MYDRDLALSNLQGLVYHKNQSTNKPTYRHHSSLPAGSLSGIQGPHRADEYISVLVHQYWCVHVQ